MNQDAYDMQKYFAETLFVIDKQRVCKFANNDIWIDGKLVCENGEIIQ